MAFTLLKTAPERFLMNYIASISERREEQIFRWAQNSRDASRRKRAKKLWTRLRTSLGDVEVPNEDEQALQQALLPRGEDVQEHFVRVRVGRVKQHWLHVYGGLLHILFYPLTLSVACVYALMEGMASMKREFSSDFANKSDVPSFAFFSETFFVGTMLLLFCSIVPLCLVAVILSAPLDIILLLLRPCFSPKVRQAVVVFFFPSCLVFTVAAAVGVPTLAHCLLGALPSAATGASIHASVDRKHYETVVAALRLCPYLDVPRTAMARESVKGMFGFKHELPGVIVWAFVFQDLQLCRAWVARSMGPDVLTAWSEPAESGDPLYLYPWDWLLACFLRRYDLTALQQAISRRRNERGQLSPELRQRLEDAIGKSARELLLGDYPDGLAEALVKHRLGIRGRHPLHVFGGIIHVILYPCTFIVALADGAITMGSDALVRGRLYFDEQKIPSYECLFNGLFFGIYGLVALLPMCMAMFLLWIAVAVPYDIVILLLRPFFSSWRCQTLVHAALPSCLTFCMAARRGVLSAKIAHCILGCLPSRYSIDFTSSPSQIVAAFRFAPYCRRRSFVESFMNVPERLAMDAAQFFVTALQRPIHASADFAPLVSWAVMLDDREICDVWEQESKRTVAITVTQISGEVLWGPGRVPSFQTVAEFKKQLKEESLNGEDRGRLRLLINGGDDGDAMARELDRDTATFMEFADIGTLSLLLVVERVDEEAIDDDAPRDIDENSWDAASSTDSSRSSSLQGVRPLLDVPRMARPGCNSTDVQLQLKDVTCIFPSNYAFAAVTNGGAVISWGAEEAGGDSSAAQQYLTEGVQQIFCTNAAYAALKSDGSVITWGLDVAGGDCSSVRSQLSSDVLHVYNTASAFAARKADGAVVCWGNPLCGGDLTLAQEQLTSGVVDIAATSDTFAALKVDGSVVTWGNVMTCDSFDAVKSQLASGVERVYANSSAFAALKHDGSVVTW